MHEDALRQTIIDHCQRMSAVGLAKGTSGNISARAGGRMLITPSAVAYEALRPEMIATIALDGSAICKGPCKPSSEWRFHHDILMARPEVGAVVHTHSAHATALSIIRRGIPPAHYMVALFGGSDVRCAGYALFGTQALSDHALEALQGRRACLLANHGAITLGRSVDEALALAVELETLAQHYVLSLQAGEPVLLSDPEMHEALRAFADYRQGA